MCNCTNFMFTPFPQFVYLDLATVLFSKEFKNGKFRKNCQHCDRRASFMLKGGPNMTSCIFMSSPFKLPKTCV